ncbi:uncharacterized protein LOC111077511 [Drosophila obscura]|uniref:uncharacterized protein LOC111077511 n=1 Tax=Drosophila obscura TaxID=7282 RepID=UPI001BB1F33A|nr:uncharacterized protein LOC111077511 [Drosophila obscura]
MEKLAQIDQATSGTFRHGQKQSDVERQVQDTFMCFEADNQQKNAYADSTSVCQPQSVVGLPLAESGDDISDTENYSDTDDECAPLLGRRQLCDDGKEYMIYQNIQEQPDSSFEERIQLDSSSEEEAQPDSSFEKKADSESLFEEEAIPLSGESKAQLVEPEANSLNREATAAENLTYSYNSDDDVVDQQEEESGVEIRAAFRGQATPKCCLTDSVFMVDRPFCAVMLGQKLPRLPMWSMETADRQAKFRILVTNVYSPFQFWFQFLENDYGYNLHDLHIELSDFYKKAIGLYGLPVTRFFLRPGYICAAKSNWGGWKRARIVSAPQENSTHVSVFYVDYGCLEEIARTELRFLPELYTNMPAMAVRGALSHVHPLAFTWPADVTDTFRRTVMSRECFAHIIEEDLQEEIYFIQIYKYKRSNKSLNSYMIRKKFAGESEHFDKQIIRQHCGRRIRYFCERLPSFEMLETGLIPIDRGDEDFNEIMSTTSYLKQFKIPPSKQPLRQDLQKALLDWLVSYKNQEMPWQKLEKEAALKAKEQDKKRRAYYEKLLAINKQTKDKEKHTDTESASESTHNCGAANRDLAEKEAEPIEAQKEDSTNGIIIIEKKGREGT